MASDASIQSRTRWDAKAPRAIEKRRDLTIQCQSDFRARFKVQALDVFLIPPDFGSQLYGWYKDHIRSSETSEDNSEVAGERTLPFADDVLLRDEAITPNPKAQYEQLQKAKRAPGPLFRFPPESKRRRKASPTTSSDTSHSDTVFTPTARGDKKLISDGDNSHETTASTSPEPATPRSQISPKGSRRSLIPQRPVQTLLSSPSDDNYGRSLLDEIRTRPKSLPNSWDETHPADKMIIRLKQEGEHWQAIARRWNEITGSSDTQGHVEWRYQHMKMRLGLFSEDAIEKLLGSAVATKSGSSASPLLGEKPGDGLGNRSDCATEMSFERELEASDVLSVKQKAMKPAKPLFVNDRKRQKLAQKGSLRQSDIHPKLETPSIPMATKQDNHTTSDSHLQGGGRRERCGTTDSNVASPIGRSKWLRLTFPTRKDSIQKILAASSAHQQRESLASDAIMTALSTSGPHPSRDRSHR